MHRLAVNVEIRIGAEMILHVVGVEFVRAVLKLGHHRAEGLPENVLGRFREKVRRIYEYLQKNTRYVSIQLGIGGFQPFDAISVASNGYGDCKALSNYTYSLLKAVGVKSNYIVINAGEGEDDIVTDFPSSQFNHVILAVPMETRLFAKCHPTTNCYQ